MSTSDWQVANQRYLMAALSAVRAALVRAVERNEVPGCGAAGDPAAALRAAAATMPGPPALTTLCEAFSLSAFERDVLLLCAGIELDATFGELCAAAQGDPQRRHATFGLALAALPDPHWSALTPARPLRRWRLLEVGPGDALTTCRLRIDERVLHHLAGLSYVDEQIADLVEPIATGESPTSTQRNLAMEIAASWAGGRDAQHLQPLQLCGDDTGAKQAVASYACDQLGRKLYRLPAALVPIDSVQLDRLIHLWRREAVLSGAVLYVDCDDLDRVDPIRAAAVARLIGGTFGPILVTSGKPGPVGPGIKRSFEVCRPNVVEQQALWAATLGTHSAMLNGQLSRLTAQFDLDASTIRAVCAGTLAQEAGDDRSGPDGLATALWERSRAQARSRLNGLARRIETTASWADLVLPAEQCRALRDIAMHVRQRATVYERWGFAAKGARGLGIAALFVGGSGTGKTMAAEVLAAELQLDLYQIDLSQVVSKYIGETEKNLRLLFDTAEGSGAVLLFDEADALFGKRSEVRDSHDRYANLEVSYLLQRMEAYRGLAILTTNMKEALDQAFQRRIRFLVHFPYPDFEQRAEIWRRVFPAATPTEGLDPMRLGRLSVAGGTIRNIALTGAFYAADAGQPVRMGHLLQAARQEFAKLEKPLTAAETAGWTS